LRSIAWQGRFLVVGFAAGDIPKLPLNLVLLKGCDVVGVFWGAWMDRDPQGHRANTEQLLTWCVEGKLSSHIHAIYPLADGPAALKALAARQVMGKVILRP
jgi:NADPH2:quinone reductase